MKSLFIVLFLAATCSVYAQTTPAVHYYRHVDDKDEVLPEKARYTATTRTNADGSTTIEWQNIRTHAIVQSQSYKDEVPVGKWFYANDAGETREEYDYTFETRYTPIPCTSPYEYRLGADTLLARSDGKFEKPVFSTSGSFYEFLASNLRYPVPAREAGWQGRVLIKGVLTKQGKLTNLYVDESRYKVLDAEAMRVIRKMTFQVPARVNGVAVDVCIGIPVSFRLDD